jgi:DNA mismatch repair protein MutH
MFDDFKELLSIFKAQKVKYLIVGGYAVSFHEQPRATKDIDLLIKPDGENARAVYEALGKFGAPLDGLTANHFITLDSSEWAASRYRGYPTRDKGGRF